MNDDELDRRLGELLRQPDLSVDQAFTDRVVALARLDRDLRRARRLHFRRALIDCAGAGAVAATFYLLSQAEVAPADGTIALQGPAMAGLAMLALWAMVSFPFAAGSKGTA